MAIQFLHPTTRRLLRGTVIRTHVQTGEILVERADDDSRVWVKPSDVRPQPSPTS